MPDKEFVAIDAPQAVRAFATHRQPFAHTRRQRFIKDVVCGLVIGRHGHVSKETLLL